MMTIMLLDTRTYLQIYMYNLDKQLGHQGPAHDWFVG